MIFRQYLNEARSCTSYLIGCPTLGVAAVVDPQVGPVHYELEARRFGLQITDVIDTHVHADHLSAAREIAETTGATLRMGDAAAVAFPFEPLKDGDVIEVGNRRIEVLHTPGHTPDHVCLLVDRWFVLTGDTLFVGDVGRVDLSLDEVEDDELERRALQLHDSLARLLELPPETEVYPGHYAGSTCGRGMDGKPSSTIGRERRSNRALSLDRDEFVRFQLSDLPPLPTDFRTIKQRNIGTSAVQKEVVEGGGW
ncbi:MAG: MBL fold metallo-hydrolase [Actinomycetota bacterium]